MTKLSLIHISFSSTNPIQGLRQTLDERLGPPATNLPPLDTNAKDQRIYPNLQVTRLAGGHYIYVFVYIVCVALVCFLK